MGKQVGNFLFKETSIKGVDWPDVEEIYYRKKIKPAMSKRSLNN